MTKSSKIALVGFFITLIGCKKDEMASYYVKNTLEKPVNFTVTELGPMDSFRSFTINPKDSAIIAEINVEYIAPEKWIKDCSLDPSDSTEIKDSSNPKKWLKSIAEDGNPIYTFSIK